MSSNSTAVASQSGILGGGNPSVYDSKNPILVFIIQAGIIIIFCWLLHWPLSKIRQPRVIAEVIGGILLGPSVFGRIPGFTDAIFPTASIPTLNATANLGLVLFLFLVGLETDLRFLVSNWRISASVSAAGMALPFGLGCAVSYGLYNQFRNDPGVVHVDFGTYLLFVGIAMAITAFPVLCRILTELKLLSTNVGVIVLSAGVGNDVTGWILLALCVALVNAGSGITALWVLLVAVGYILFLSFVLRPVFIWYLRKTGSLEKGPSQSVVTVTLLLALASAFFTQAIGIHAIFGGFVVGLICPHEGGFAIKLTEKIEDLVAAIFLPLYFALSGLQTNLGLLNSGIVWGYVIAIIAIAFFAKVVGGTLASRFTGLLWRESLTVGVLMSCKGLVELIVLNIGLQAKILSQRTFTMFVVMALVTTFMTTPLTSFLYPKWYQDKVARWRRGEIDWDGNVIHSDDSQDDPSSLIAKLNAKPIEKVTVYLRLDSLASVCTFVGLLGARSVSKDSAPRMHYSKRSSPVPTQSSTESQINAVDSEPSALLHAHGVRLIELTDRLSSTMQVSEIQEYSIWDPVVNVFRSFGQINNIPSEGRVSVVPESSYADAVLDMVRDTASEFLLVPWSASGNMSDLQSVWGVEDSSNRVNASYPSFVSEILQRSSVNNVGILIDRALEIPSKEGLGLERSSSGRTVPNIRTNLASLTTGNREQHLLFMYFGGADDRFALRFVLQLARNELVTATIIYVDVPASTSQTTAESSSSAATHEESDAIFFASIRDSLPAELSSRVVFRKESLTNTATTAASLAVGIAQDEATRARDETNQMVIVGRRTVQEESSPVESGGEADTQRALGVVGNALVRRGVKASVLVLQGVA
ncbi:putative K homeostasis protein Kha1 [Talaromyces proteolyticus]|uniref:K homeostasis protein Kha1 n=1 Tax=Talaromyces proteolyticus TaxID=1131652 RepID=A0AAD4Q4K1_9EURO|nr:putative K homeostasis protein Kha1 [Talaromyces proteolyticus]KAH8703189.1 putative K homeostasis protein Kha1 [Talaromyces proteolyticus]